MRNTVITGGLQGIGRALVQQAQARGDAVFVFDIVSTDDQRVVLLKEQGVRYFSVDVSQADQVAAAFTELKEILGEQGAGLDVLVNNAGITRDNLVLRMKESEWDTVLNVNLKGSYLCSQQAIKQFLRRPVSYLINISSVVGLYGNPGQANYAASKAGLIALTKTLAYEYAGRNVLVNAIAPGFIQTEMTDKLSQQHKKMALERIALSRFGTPEDIAQLVIFLTSGRADYITGQVIEVSGGMT